MRLKFTSEVKEFNSKTLFVNIPNIIKKELNLKKGDLVNISIVLNISNSRIKASTFKCLACSCTFTSDDDFPYCPACENEKLEVVDDK